MLRVPQIVNDPYGPTSPFLVGDPDGDLRLAVTTSRIAGRTAGFELWVTGDGVDAAVEGGFLAIVAVDEPEVEADDDAQTVEDYDEGGEPELPEVTVTVDGVDMGPPSVESRPDFTVVGEQIEPKPKPAKPVAKATKRGQ